MGVTRNLKDITGLRFSRLVVLSYLGKAKWNCLCDCGRMVKATGTVLRAGTTKSCGCWRMDNVCLTGTHLGSHSKIYGIWGGIKRRCYNKKEKNYYAYGGSGITVCEEWRHDFVAFRNLSLSSGYQAGLEIDRVNNVLGYSPNNCRFVTHRQNCLNKRSNHKVEAFGEIKTIAEWADDSR